MSLITGSAYAGLSTRNGAPVIAGLLSGEALKAGAMCYIKSDGLVYECLGTSGSAASCPFGATPRQVASGEPVSLYGAGAIFQFAGTSWTIGARLFMSVSDAGYFDSAAQIGDKEGVAVAIDAKNFMVTRANGATSTEV